MAHSELNERLQFYGIPAQDSAYANISRAIGRRMDDALGAFYEELARRPELASKFADAQMMERARRAQAAHWRSVFDAGVTESFRQRSAHIGAVHARIELEPKFYVGSYARILDELITELIAPGWQRHLPWKRAEARRVAALVKVSLLDIEVALSAYFFDLKGKVTAVTEGLSVPLDHLAHGRLVIEPVKLPPEYSKVAADFNATIGSLKDTVGTVIDSVSGMTTGSREICSAAEDLARRTEEQAANLEEAAASIAQTTARVRESAATAAQARDTIAETNTRANEGAQIVSEAVIAMSQIEKSSQEITNIISVIDSIAFQTNLLALNAGVEAARAGETGKGFAVVASEVRALAQRCAQAAEEVKALISVSSTHVSAGVDLVSRSGDAFAGITKDVAELSGAIQTMAESARLQAEDLSQINTVVGDLDRSTQQNAAMAEECTAAATSLVQEASALSAQLAHFDVGRGDGDGQFGAARRAAMRNAA